jgi:hypothetical protein
VRAHVAEVVKGLWRRVALTEVDAGVGIVGPWLLNTGRGSSIGAFVNGRLHLLQELINVHEIVLGS